MLSESTAVIGRGRKVELYQKIPELREHLIIQEAADLFVAPAKAGAQWLDFPGFRLSPE